MADISFSLFDRPIPLIRQAEEAECGLACLAMVLVHLGTNIDLTELRRNYALSLKGASLKQIIDIAHDVGLGTRAIRCELEDLEHLQTPVILHWNLSHFVLLENVRKGTFTVLDPAKGRFKLAAEEVSKKFTGIALEIAPTSNLKIHNRRPKLRILDLVYFSARFWTATAQAVLLSFLLQFFVLAAPFFMQLVIDQAIASSDTSLLFVVALGFALLKLFEVISEVTRAFLLQYIASLVGYQMEGGVLNHLLRLPIGYFEKRFVGDVQQRFYSVQAIQQVITSGTSSVLIDGVFAITLGIVLFVYQPILAAVSLAFILLYGLSRLVMMNMNKTMSMDAMVSFSRKQSQFLETLRAIQTIKLSAMEPKREEQWRDLSISNINQSIKLENINALFGGLNRFLLGISQIVVVFIAAKLAIAGDFTVGMIVAFLAYKQSFEARLMSLLEFVVRIKLLDVQLERIADIVETEPEVQIDVSSNRISTSGRVGSICFEQVTFRYASTEENVLDGASFHIEPGEHVVFCGTSGAGKSTLLKLLVGIYRPTSGRILVDGKSLDDWPRRQLRHKIGVLMQDDKLISGTIAQNISMFEDMPDQKRIEEVCRIAAVASDIEAMPMKY